MIIVLKKKYSLYLNFRTFIGLLKIIFKNMGDMNREIKINISCIVNKNIK